MTFGQFSKKRFSEGEKKNGLQGKPFTKKIRAGHWFLLRFFPQYAIPYMEIGSASIMRGYMAHPCDEELTPEKKLRLFLTMSLRAYNVPKEELEQAIRFVEGLDIRTISERVMQELFQALAMRYEFSLAGIPAAEESK